MKNKRSVRVKAERGYGPRHAFNAQEGSEAVPSELPSPPAEDPYVMKRNSMGNLRPAAMLQALKGELSGLSKEDVAKLGISMLMGGEGPEPMMPGKAGAVPLHVWDSWETVSGPSPKAGKGVIKVDDAGNHYEMVGSHETEPAGPASYHIIAKQVEPQQPYDFNKWQEQVGKGQGQYEEPPLSPEWLSDVQDKAAAGGDVAPTHQELNKAFGTNMPEGMSMDELLDWYAKGLGLKPKEPPTEPPPEGMKRGKRTVQVHKGFGPAHANNAKEGEDLTQVNTDTVPAMLTPRESVLNRNASELAGRDNIEALNAEGNQLARKGVDLAAGGDDDVEASPMVGSFDKKGASPFLQELMGAVEGDRRAQMKDMVRRHLLGGKVFTNEQFDYNDPLVKQVIAELGARSNPAPDETSYPQGQQRGTSDMKKKSINSKPKQPQSGSPYVQAFQKLMPPAMPQSQPSGYAQGVSGVPTQMPPYSTSGGGRPSPMPQMPPSPQPRPQVGMPPAQMPPMYNSIGGGGRPMPLPAYAGGSAEVAQGPIGTPPQNEQAFGPPVQLTAPQIQAAAKQAGLSQGQIAGLMKAFQGGQQAYSSIGSSGTPDAASMFSDAGAGYQGGISDIGYPPFVAPSANYDGNRGGWLGPYDPSFMIQRYAGGISSVPFR